MRLQGHKSFTGIERESKAMLQQDTKLEPIGNLLAGVREFKPFAYHDKHLDAIRVQLVDCRYKEHRFDQIITVYKSTEKDGNEEIIGFAIKGVSHLLNEVGMTGITAVKIAAFLDALVKLYPTESTKKVRELATSWGDEIPDEIEYAEAA